MSAAPPSVGSPAPEFTLDSTAGSPVTLSHLRGTKHALLCFFPLAFTGVCTAEMCELSDDFDRFTARDVDVLPISVDSVASLREFKAKHAMKVDLLSDFKRDASRAYGVLMEDKFFSRRAYFLVGRDGLLRWSHVEEHNGLRRPTAELMEQIAAL
ncbi:MAG: redoxin domain-containing protein, partial [Gemmatimonadaceae bacterium]